MIKIVGKIIEFYFIRILTPLCTLPHHTDIYIIVSFFKKSRSLQYQIFYMHSHWTWKLKNGKIIDMYILRCIFHQIKRWDLNDTIIFFVFGLVWFDSLLNGNKIMVFCFEDCSDNLFKQWNVRSVFVKFSFSVSVRTTRKITSNFCGLLRNLNFDKIFFERVFGGSNLI